MKAIRKLVLILSACVVPVAWARQPAGRGDWTEFHPRLYRSDRSI
jgi:hypothetical protein